MDYTNPSGAEDREVSEVEHQGRSARTVAGSRTYDTEIEDLWDGLTNPERIPRWLLPISGDLQLGGRYQLEGNASGTITRCEPPTRLEVTWEYDDQVSWVSVHLSADESGSRLRLEHTMLKDEAGEAHWATYGPGATGVGWDLSFLGMALHIDNGGAVINNDENAEWLASTTGARFIRSCANAWADAHVDSTGDPDTALAMARRTGDFYTTG